MSNKENMLRAAKAVKANTKTVVSPTIQGKDSDAVAQKKAGNALKRLRANGGIDAMRTRLKG